jgi:2-polyprenyl-3-methyl-5-hydroxy-6-metoxy-1,4-benzoquinol methylase
MTISSNLRKHQSKNPLKRIALKNFYREVFSFQIDVQTVLDAGCGEGFGAQQMQDRFPAVRIYGADISLPALIHSRQVADRLSTAQADSTHLPFGEGQFDLVMSLEVLEHLPEPEAALEAYKQAANRYLLLSVPNDPVFRALRMLEGSDLLRLGDHPEHVNHWNLFTFPKFLRRNGLRILEIRVPFPFVWVIVLCAVDDGSQEMRTR